MYGAFPLLIVYRLNMRKIEMTSFVRDGSGCNPSGWGWGLGAKRSDPHCLQSRKPGAGPLRASRKKMAEYWNLA